MNRTDLTYWLLLTTLIMAASRFQNSYAAESVASADEVPYPIVFCCESRPVFMRLFIRVNGQPLAKTWQEYREQLFTRLDADANGSLDETERQAANRVVAVARRAPSRGSAPTPTNWECPADESGACPRPMFLEAFDEVSETSLRRLGNTSLRGTRTQPAAFSLFTMFDENGDGKLHPSELMDWSKWIKHDWDDDGMITEVEFQISGPPQSAAQSRVANAPKKGLRAQLLLEDINLSPHMISTLIGQYDGSAPAVAEQSHRPKDGMLDAAELGLTAEQFVVHDRDLNDRLDFLELQNLFRSPESLVDLEFELGQPGSAIRWASPEIDAKVDRRVIRIQVDGNATTFFVERGSSNFDVASLVEQRFPVLDRDKNGYLDENDVGPSQVNDLLAADADGNRMIYPDELKAAAIEQAAWHNSHAAIGVRSVDGDLFYAIDANRDVRVSKPELLQAQEELQQWDRNKNQLIEQDEVPASWTVTLMQDRGAILEILSAPVPNQTQRFAAVRDLAPRWFALMDRNGDNMVSRREFLGKLEEFSKLDVNQDEYLSREEIHAK